MILQQSPYETAPIEFLPTRIIVQEILRFKHHQNMVNNRYALIFEQFYGNYACPAGGHQRWAQDVLVFAKQREMLKKFYRIQEVAGSIKPVILNRIKKDSIAPLLRSNQSCQDILAKLQRRERASNDQLPQSNTMHSESSRKKSQCTPTQVQKVMGSNQELNRNESHQRKGYFSNQLARRISQDFHKTIRNVCVPEKKKTHFNAKFIKSVIPKSFPRKDKQFKRIHTEENLKAIKSNMFQRNLTQHFYTCEDPDQNYGLKKFKKNSMKNKNHKNKQSIERKRTLNSMQQRKQISETKRKKNHICLSPLTPKPVSVSKNKWGWEENPAKCSRFSLKSRVTSSKKLLGGPLNPKSPSMKIKSSKMIPKSPIKNIYKSPH